jgi:putative ATP-dependent endonuclease of the OLD family
MLSVIHSYEVPVLITRVIVKNYRCLKSVDLQLNPDLNIIVGNNECGKSTLLEAIHLALTGQIEGRSILSESPPHFCSIWNW